MPQQIWEELPPEPWKFCFMIGNLIWERNHSAFCTERSTPSFLMFSCESPKHHWLANSDGWEEGRSSREVNGDSGSAGLHWWTHCESCCSPFSPSFQLFSRTLKFLEMAKNEKSNTFFEISGGCWHLQGQSSLFLGKLEFMLKCLGNSVIIFPIRFTQKW